MCKCPTPLLSFNSSSHGTVLVFSSELALRIVAGTPLPSVRQTIQLDSLIPVTVSCLLESKDAESSSHHSRSTASSGSIASAASLDATGALISLDEDARISESSLQVDTRSASLQVGVRIESDEDHARTGGSNPIEDLQVDPSLQVGGRRQEGLQVDTRSASLQVGGRIEFASLQDPIEDLQVDASLQVGCRTQEDMQVDTRPVNLHVGCRMEPASLQDLQVDARRPVTSRIRKRSDTIPASACKNPSHQVDDLQVDTRTASLQVEGRKESDLQVDDLQVDTRSASLLACKSASGFKCRRKLLRKRSWRSWHSRAATLYIRYGTASGICFRPPKRPSGIGRIMLCEPNSVCSDLFCS